MTATVELRMPLGYVELDDEEMEYLEGGRTYKVTTLTPQQCNDIVIGISLGFGVAATVAGLIPGGQAAAAVITIIGLVGAAYFGWAGNHNGMDVMCTQIGWRKHYWYKIRW